MKIARPRAGTAHGSLYARIAVRVPGSEKYQSVS
jgi:hypothetical protein